MSGDNSDKTGMTGFIYKATRLCFTVLLGAMALYGAVKILSAVWVPLCIGSAALAGLVGVWFVIRRGRDW